MDTYSKEIEIFRSLFNRCEDVFAVPWEKGNNIDNNKAISKKLEKSILLMEFNQEYLKVFFKSRNIN